MSISHSYSDSWQSGSNIISRSVTMTGTEEINLDFSLAANTTAQAEPMVFNKTSLQSIYIVSDQNISILTNSSTEPQETLTIKASVAFSWNISSGIPVPFAGNVTAFYFTNATATAANISVRTLVA